MKTPLVAPLVAPLLLVLLLTSLVTPSRAQSPVIPKGWLKAEDLERAEGPLQKQLDTGVAMLDTAWNMAAVKDAELFVVYVSVFEKLAEPERAALRKEQEAWLKRREKAAAAADDGKSGQIGHLQSASEHQDWTQKRIVELKKRMAKQ